MRRFVNCCDMFASVVTVLSAPHRRVSNNNGGEDRSRRIGELFGVKKAGSSADGRQISNPVRRFEAKQTQLLEVDDDAAVGSSTLAPLAFQEHDLVDDAFTYFPPLSDGSSIIDEAQGPSASRERYVPGQQVIEPGFSRYRVDVQYSGSDFDGWSKSTEKRRVLTAEAQRQLQAKGIVVDDNAIDTGISKPRAKSALEDALAIAFDLDNVKIQEGATPEIGCTVRRLTCHVDIPDIADLQPRTIMQRATMWLEKKGAPLAILSCQKCVNQQFHARHSATRRIYVYRILNRIAPPLFDAGLQWHVDRYLDVERMQRFAERLQGTMDYGCFADPKMAHALRKQAAYGELKSKPDSTDAAVDRLVHAATQPKTSAPPPRPDTEFLHLSATVRTVDSIRVVRQDDEVLLWFVGKSFLRHQIRNMVSVLRLAGHGLWSEHELEQHLRRGFDPSRTRVARERPTPAPVHGLTLWELEYPPKHRDDFVPFVDSGPLDEATNLLDDDASVSLRAL